MAAEVALFQELREAVADERRMRVVDHLELGDGGFGVVETFRRNRRRTVEMAHVGLHADPSLPTFPPGQETGAPAVAQPGYALANWEGGLLARQ